MALQICLACAKATISLRSESEKKKKKNIYIYIYWKSLLNRMKNKQTNKNQKGDLTKTIFHRRYKDVRVPNPVPDFLSSILHSIFPFQILQSLCTSRTLAQGLYNTVFVFLSEK